MCDVDRSIGLGRSSPKMAKKNRKNFWTQNLGCKKRFQVTCFLYVNGVNPEIYFEWVKLIGNIKADNKKAWHHIRELFKKFNENDNQVLSKYWAFNVFNIKYEYSNVITRYY